MDCGARQAVGGPCRACTADPTLDLRDKHVRDMLLADDDARRSRRSDRIRYVSVPVGIVVVIALAFVPGMSLVFAMGPFFSGYIGAMVGVALLVMKLIDVTWPFKPRFPYLKS